MKKATQLGGFLIVTNILCILLIISYLPMQ